MLFRIFLWICTNIRACGRLFPILDNYVFMRFKTGKVSSLESKSNLIIFPTSLIKKRLFRDICCNLLIMVLMTIVSLSLKVHQCSFENLSICQYLCLHMKIICWRFHIKTPFTFWDMRTWDMWKVCLQTFRYNRIC